MEESVTPIVEKLLQLPEEQLTIILEMIAKEFGLNIEPEEEDIEEEKLKKEQEGNEGGNETETAEDEETKVNPQELISKIAF